MTELSAANGRDLVARALEFRGPERVPVSFLPPRHSDIAATTIPDARGWHIGGVTAYDQWGCGWTTLDASMGKVTEHPLASWDDLATYPWPDFSDPECYRLTEVIVDRAGGRYVLAWLPGNFSERSKQLRGDAAFLLDLRAEPARVDELLGRMEETLVDVIRRYARLGVHGVAMTDDWGMQDRLWIRLDLWRRVFRPRYAAVARAAHAEGLHFWLHSCGYIWDIIEDLVEIGVDCLDLDQPELTGVDRLAERFAGRISFQCPVDIQATLQAGTLEEVAAAARRLMRRLGGRNGGFIGKEYTSPQAIKLRPEAVETMYRVFVEEGRYPFPT